MTVDLRVSLKIMSIADFQNSAINSLVISVNFYSSLSLQVKTGGELIHSTDEDNKLKVHVNFRLFFFFFHSFHLHTIMNEDSPTLQTTTKQHQNGYEIIARNKLSFFLSLSLSSDLFYFQLS